MKLFKVLIQNLLKNNNNNRILVLQTDIILQNLNFK